MGRWTIGFGIAFAATACRDATQVTLELRTDVLCQDLDGTDITVSVLSALDARPVAASTQHCEDGYIGTLALVPSKGRDGEVGIKVVTGVGKSPEQCASSGFTGGCIVARRALSFIPGHDLRLPVQLEVACIDVPCGATETCSNGVCAPATLDDPLDCTDPLGCDRLETETETDDEQLVPHEVDASVADAGVPGVDVHEPNPVLPMQMPDAGSERLPELVIWEAATPTEPDTSAAMDSAEAGAVPVLPDAGVNEEPRLEAGPASPDPDAGGAADIGIEDAGPEVGSDAGPADAAAACVGPHADSVAEFSLVQGQGGWYYGYYVAPFTQDAFVVLPETSTAPADGDIWVTAGQAHWTFVGAVNMHPNGDPTTGRQSVEHHAVRRWRSDVAGVVNIRGTVMRYSSTQGNGVLSRIVVDDTEVYSRHVQREEGGQAIPFDVEVTLRQGSLVDFVIDPYEAQDNTDKTALRAVIDCPK